MANAQTISRLQPEECPPGSNRQMREHFAMVIRRLDWLSTQMRLMPNRNPDGGDWRLAEFDAITWLLAHVVGQEVVDRWMGKYEVQVPHLRHGRETGTPDLASLGGR